MNTQQCYCNGFPYPDLSRLAEMDGYLQELATETGDDAPLLFWREIRRSINRPIIERIRKIRKDTP